MSAEDDGFVTNSSPCAEMSITNKQNYFKA